MPLESLVIWLWNKLVDHSKVSVKFKNLYYEKQNLQILGGGACRCPSKKNINWGEGQTAYVGSAWITVMCYLLIKSRSLSSK